MTNGIRRQQAGHAIKLFWHFDPSFAASLDQALEVMRERKGLLVRDEHRLDGLLDGLLGMKSDDRVGYSGDADDRPHGGGIVASPRE